MEKLKKLTEPVLWFLAAVFLVWGWQLWGTGPAVIALIVIVVIAVYMYVLTLDEYLDEWTAQDLLPLCLSLGVAAVSSAWMESQWFGLLILVLFMVGSYFLVGGIGFQVQLSGSILAFFLIMFWEGTFGSNSSDNYFSQKELHAEWIKNVNTFPMPQTLKDEILQNPFLVSRKDNLISREISRMDSLSRILDGKTGKVIAALREVKSREAHENCFRFEDKTEILRVKYLWMTGDVLPWTYSMWKTIEHNMSFSGSYSGRGIFSSGGRFSGSGTVRPDINGEASYIGNNELSYINIVFSDNSYERFSIKDNPEWLLVREGEQVKVKYSVAYANISLEDLVKPCGYVSKEYVPLFK